MLSGCVSVGTKVDVAQLDRFQSGVTTLAEVEAKLGPPNQTYRNSDGTTMIVYAYVHGSPSASSFIPYIGPFVGKTTATNSSVILNFDTDGKLTKYATGAGTTCASVGAESCAPKH